MKKIVMCILDRFADWEASFVSAWLHSEIGKGKYEVLYASVDKEIKKSMGNLNVVPHMAFSEIPKDIEALILVGADGTWRKSSYPELIEKVKMVKENNILLGAICDSAYFLAKNGLLNDVNHTVNDINELAQEKNYTNKDGYIEADSVSFNKVVTANGNSPLEFAKDILLALGAADEKTTMELYDFFKLGYFNALRKYGYIK